ncbi:MAG: hypothetical protein PHH13_00450, partial [Candidatus Peribacteraceae bacterium]|nr:hypothetical protein [Candidatus Peribacteraceae bacterium]
MHSVPLSTGDILKLQHRALAEGCGMEVLERLRWFQHLAEYGCVSTTCREFKIARSTLYRWIERFDPSDLTSLTDHPTHRVSRRQHVVQRENVEQPSSAHQNSLQCAIESRKRVTLSGVEGSTCFSPSWFDYAHHDTCSVKHTHNSATGILRKHLRIGLLVLAFAINAAILASLLIPSSASASSWKPTLLVNTEAFQVIDDSDSTANVYIKFGDTLAETLTFNRTATRFQFSDNLYVAGKLDVTGTMSGNRLSVSTNQAIGTGAVFVDVNGNSTGMLLDSEATTAPGIAIDMNGASGVTPHILFGYRGTFDVNLFRSAANVLKTDDSLYVSQTLSGAYVNASSTFEGAGLTDCDTAATSKLLWDATTKKFSCGTDQGLTQAIADNRYVNTSGDTMTGALKVRANLSGTTLRVDNNADIWGSLGVSGTTILDGNVGIGVTGTPETKLEVAGTMSGKSLQVTGTGATPILYTDITRGNVGIGTASPRAALDLTLSSATATGMIIKSAASQTTNLQEWQDSAGSIMAAVASSGTLLQRNTSPTHRLFTTGDGLHADVQRSDAGAFNILNQVQTPSGISHSLLTVAASKQYALEDESHADLDLTNDFTVSVWVKVTSTSSYQGYVSRYQQATTNGWTLASSADGTKFGFVGGGAEIDANATIQTGVWYHVLGMVRNGQRRLYINGSAQTATSETAFTNPTSGKLTLGRFYFNYDGFYADANIDDVRVYSRALTDDEVTSLAGGGDPSSIGLLVQWKLNESSGTVVSDSTGLLHAATTYASPSWSTDIPSQNPSPTVGSTDTVTIISSQNGVDSGEKGVAKFGGADGRTDLQYGTTLRTFLSTTEVGRWDSRGRFGLGTTTPGSKLSVSGSLVVGNNIGATTANSGVSLEVIGTASGRLLHAQDRLTSSGTLSVTGAASLQSTVRINGVTYTFPYGDGAASGRVLATNGAGQLAWASVSNLVSGSLTEAIADNRYVNTSGDTMTGALKVRANLSGSTLTVDQTADIFGNLAVSGTTILDGNVGIGVTGTPETKLEVAGTMSGKSLQVTGTGATPILYTDITRGNVGIGTTSLDTDAKLEIKDGRLYFSDADVNQSATDYAPANVYGRIGPLSTTAGGWDLIGASDTDASAMRIMGVMGSTNPTDSTPAIIFRADKSDVAGSRALGLSETAFQFQNYWNNYLMTILGSGNVGMGTITPETKLEVVGTASGSELHAQDRLTSSGTLSVTGAASLQSTVRINGVTYTFPYGDGAASGRVLATNAAGQLSWANVNSLSTGFLTQTHGDNRYVNVAGDTMTGALKVRANISGATLRVDGGSDLWGNLSVSGTTILDGSVGIGITAPEQKLHIGGGHLLLDNNQEIRFKDSNGIQRTIVELDENNDVWYGGSMTGSVIFAGGGEYTERFRIDDNGNVAFDTNVLFVNVANDRVGIGTTTPETALEVIGTASGSELHAQDRLTSSGTLSVTGAASLQSTVRINGVTYTFPYGDGAASGRVLATNATGQLSWANVNSLATGFLTQTNADARYVNVAGDTMTGALKVRANLSGSSLRVDGYSDLWGNLGVSGTTLINGNLGVGVTGTPQTKLEVAGTMSGKSLYVTGTGGTPLITTDTANGWVGVGVATPTDGYTMDVNNRFGVRGADNNLAFAAVDDGTKTYWTGNDQPEIFIGNTTNDGYLTFGTRVTSTNYERMRIANDGSVGIGTNNPTTLLEVNGAMSGHSLRMRDSLASSGTLSITGAASLQSTVRINGVTYTFPYGDGAASGRVLKTNGAGQLVWAIDAGSVNGLTYIDGDTRYVNVAGDTMTGALKVRANLSGSSLRVDGYSDLWGNLGVSGTTLINGNLGVGVTGTPQTKLEVAGTMSGKSLQVTGTGASPILYTDQTTGRVGIGTTAPASKLAIYSDDNKDTGPIINLGGSAVNQFESGRLRFTETSMAEAVTGYKGAFIHYDGSADRLNIGVHDVADQLTSSDVNAISILRISGNVGIGTMNPDAKLEVIGTASGRELHAQDILTSSGGLSVTGAARFGSTVKLNGVTYTFPYGDGAASGRVLKTNGAGQLVWAIDAGSVNGLTYIDGDTRYVNVAGDTMTGALKVRANLSGSTLRVDRTADIWGNLGVSGTTILDGNVGIGVTDTPETKLEVAGTMSGKSLQVTGTGATPIISTQQTTGRVGIGIVVPEANLHVYDASSDGMNAATVEHNTTATNVIGAPLRIVRTSTGDMEDGFGTMISYAIKDTANVSNTIGQAGFIRNGADNSGMFSISPSNEGNLQLSKFIVDKAGNVGIGTTAPDTKLEVIGTASGRLVHAQDRLTSSGTLSVTGAASLQSTVRINGVTYTFPYGDGAASGRVLATNGAGQLAWADAGDLITGSLTESIADNRYVNTSGDTMTGALKVRANLSGSSLTVDQTADIFGNLAVSGTTILDGNVGIGVTGTPETKLEVAGTMSGKSLYITGTGSTPLLIADATTGNISIGRAAATGSKLDIQMNTDSANGISIRNANAGGSTWARLSYWNGSTGGDTVHMGLTGEGYTDTTFGADTFVINSSSGIGGGMRFVADSGDISFNTTGDTSGDLTIKTDGKVGIGTTTPETTLEVIGTMSGNLVHAQDRLTSSGTLSVTGAASLQSTVRINGVTYTFPYGDGAASGKVLKTNGAGQLTWATDSTGGSGGLSNTGALMLILDNRYVNTSGDTMTGALKVRANLSGSSLTVDQTADIFGNLAVSGTTILDGNVGIGVTGTPETKLEVAGTMSGRSLQVTGTGANPILYTDQTTGRVGIGTTTPSQKLTLGYQDRFQIDGQTPSKRYGEIWDYGVDGNVNVLHIGSANTYASGVVGAGSEMAFDVMSRDSDAYSEAMRIIHNGNVGIGTFA